MTLRSEIEGILSAYVQFLTLDEAADCLVALFERRYPAGPNSIDPADVLETPHD